MSREKPSRVATPSSSGRRARAWLPELVVQGLDEPVVQVVDERAGEVVYTLRIQGRTFRPKVFLPGVYTIKVMGQPGPSKTFEGVVATGQPEGRLEVDLLREAVDGSTGE